MNETIGIYSQVQQCVRQVIHDLTEASDAIINPGAVGREAYQRSIGDAEVPLLIEWTSVEQFKQLARVELRGKFNHGDDNKETYQDDMFSGHLQKYYPVRARGDEECFYKLRELLTDDEIDQNLASLKKGADARVRHYDFLFAYKIQRKGKAA